MKRIIAITAAAVAALTLTAGGAVAGGLITSKDIKNDTIRSVDIRDNTVTGLDVRDSSLVGRNIKDGTVSWFDLDPGLRATLGKDTPAAAGATGPKGDTGERGPAGADGAPGADGQDGADGTANPSAAGAGYAGFPADNPHHDLWQPGVVSETVQKCRAGEYVTGGGYSQQGGDATDLGGSADVQITVSAPYTGDYQPISGSDSRFYADRWIVRGVNNGTEPVDVRAWVLCAPLPGN